MCPWFTEYAMAKKYKTFKDIRGLRSFMSTIGADKLIQNIVYTPIDLFSLWDKVMVHEMMHTKAGGGQRDKEGVHSYGKA